MCHRSPSLPVGAPSPSPHAITIVTTDRWFYHGCHLQAACATDCSYLLATASRYPSPPETPPLAAAIHCAAHRLRCTMPPRCSTTAIHSLPPARSNRHHHLRSPLTPMPSTMVDLHGRCPEPPSLPPSSTAGRHSSLIVGDAATVGCPSPWPIACMLLLTVPWLPSPPFLLISSRLPPAQCHYPLLAIATFLKPIPSFYLYSSPSPQSTIATTTKAAGYHRRFLLPPSLPLLIGSHVSHRPSPPNCH